MKKKVTLLIALSIIIVCIITPIVCFVGNSEPVTAKQETKSDPLPSKTVEEKTLPPVEEVEEKVILKSNSEIAKEIIAGKWGSGEERKQLLTNAGYDYNAIQTEVQKLLPKEEVKVEKPTSLPTGNYPTAQYVWDWLIAHGWSEVAAAGVIGNMMAETGGKTLNLDWDSEGGCGFGLIQWIGGRRTLLKNKYGSVPTIEQQLQYMTDELYGTNGVTRQVSESQLNAIFNASTPEDSAYAFACYYERCAQQYRWFRRDLARTAYNYFTQK